MRSGCAELVLVGVPLFMELVKLHVDVFTFTRVFLTESVVGEACECIQRYHVGATTCVQNQLYTSEFLADSGREEADPVLDVLQACVVREDRHFDDEEQNLTQD